MKRRYFLLLVIALSGCVIPTGPQPRLHSNFERTLYDNFLYNPALKPGYYDGIFSTIWQRGDYLDSAGADTGNAGYQTNATLYNALGNVIQVDRDKLSLALNGISIIAGQYVDNDTMHNLNFPAPVTWSLAGDSYFPSFTHTISSEEFPDILGPPASDTLSASIPFTLTYVAPNADSITISLLYLGSGYVQFNNDTGWTYENDFPYFPQNTLVENTGQEQIPPLVMRDTNFIRSFIPHTVLLTVAWAHGDTMQRDGKLYGFVTEVARTRDYTLKP
ncbi:MAG TPA: hypothetical protein VFD13_03965 [Candidatus Kapabacteria bacterium]|nr:hypothetical protein [Candidatus Kapabacteria bacterium]